MTFDQPTRNRLQRFVSNAKSLLTEEFVRQVQNDYGLDPTSGHVATLNDLAHLDDARLEIARVLRETLAHYKTASPDKNVQEALDRIVREQAFTVLNRLAAIRMAEARDLLIESVGAGHQSKGFQLYTRLSGSGLGETGDAYRSYLFSIFDELAMDLPVLFDRFSHQGLLFPRESALMDLLKLINDPEISSLWTEDETIGWIYQYFNPSEERKAMRDASSAPRNSRELAVRNQFFTPRYVVEFLTDNTLGRLWYEMTKGKTIILENCHSLVRWPDEKFLSPNQTAPSKELQLTHNELIKTPVYITHRPKKDPRDFRILDPACGSGHFLLYCFDLLQLIYQESWQSDDQPTSEMTGTTLREDYATIDELQLSIPKLIIENNLHGIDIDLRAVQIAVLALWLRAQKFWQHIEVKAPLRPQILNSNIVCAEPMPGEQDLRKDFLMQVKPPVLSQIVEAVFDKMKLAGEAGSLLKIEQEITGAVEAAKTDWLHSKPEQQSLFTTHVNPRPEKQTARFDLTGITDERFWEEAEEQILATLKTYAENAENNETVRRRLFTKDAARGFAFIDVCRKHYDVVLMNPPFGLAPKHAFDYLKKAYPDTYVDMYASSVTRGKLLAPNGMVGAISSRAFLTTKKLTRWRTNEVVDHLSVLLDLGLGVMDDAFVESCAYVLSGSTSPLFIAINRRNAQDKGANVTDLASDDTFIVPKNEIRSLPTAKILYSLPPEIHALLRSDDVFEPDIGTVRQGLTTFDDFRFIRLRWEVKPRNMLPDSVFEPLAKGGEFSKYYSDLPLLIRWDKDGRELAEVNRRVNGQIAQARQASEYYRRPGATYSKRSAKGFSARTFPAGSLMTNKGPIVLSESDIQIPYIIGWLNSRLIRSLIHIQANAHEFNTAILKKLPWVYSNTSNDLTSTVFNTILALRKSASTIETNSFFCPVFVGNSMLEIVESLNNIRCRALQLAKECETTWDDAIDQLYQVNSKSVEISDDDDNDDGDDDDENPTDADENEQDTSISEKTQKQVCSDLISYIIGCIFGRWDVRMVQDASLIPHFADPFDRLPVCPPATLISPDGFPAESGQIVSEESLRNRNSTNDLPHHGSVKISTISDIEYPLPIQWNGILTESLAVNPTLDEDIIARIRQVLDLLYKTQSESIERQICQILGVDDLREYLRKPTGFFQDHLKRYSKSRRQAPIYWPISTPSGSYTLWLYYHRLTDQTLYVCVNDFIEPKLRDTNDEIARLRDSNKTQDRATSAKLEKLEEFALELAALKEDLLGIARSPYSPHLDDGVQINASPLWKHFLFKPWQKKLQQIWRSLEAGDYNWSHLAYTSFPNAVRTACASDRSIAVAHNLEQLFKGEEVVKRKRPSKAINQEEK